MCALELELKRTCLYIHTQTCTHKYRRKKRELVTPFQEEKTGYVNQRTWKRHWPEPSTLSTGRKNKSRAGVCRQAQDQAG